MGNKSNLQVAPCRGERYGDATPSGSSDLWLLEWSAISGAAAVGIGVLTGTLPISPWIIPALAAWIFFCAEFGNRICATAKDWSCGRAKKIGTQLMHTLFLVAAFFFVASLLFWPGMSEVLFAALLFAILLVLLLAGLTIFVGLPIIIARGIIKALGQR